MENLTERRIRRRTVLTPRGRLVRTIFLITLALIAVYWADEATTPEKCKVEFEQLDQGCLDLLYPN